MWQDLFSLIVLSEKLTSITSKMQDSKLSGGMDNIFLIEAQNSDMHYDSYTCVLIIQFETTKISFV